MSNELKGQAVIDGRRIPVGFQQITNLTAAVGLTVPEGALIALIQAETQSVRWRDDGTDPTAGVGNVITADSILLYTGKLSAIKFIQATATAKLNVSFYR
jgi:hypothetical protein